MRNIFAVSTNLDPPPARSEEVTSVMENKNLNDIQSKERAAAFDKALMACVCPHCASSVRRRSRIFRDDFFECGSCGRCMETIFEFANKRYGE